MRNTYPADLRTKAELRADLARVQEARERLRVDRDDLAADLARCRDDLEHMTEARAAARADADRLAAKASRLAARVAELEGSADVPRPEMCRSLTECTGNRAAAERVSRIVEVSP